MDREYSNIADFAWKCQYSNTTDIAPKLISKRSDRRERDLHPFLPEKLFEKASRGHLDKRLRLPVCQDNHACLGGWSQYNRSTETRIFAVVINQVHAANVGGEPAKRIVQVLGSSGRPPVHPHVDLRAMQLCHHFCREYPMPEHCSVVKLQQRIARHFIDACIDATPRPQGL